MSLVGQKAPLFTLVDTEKKEVALDSLLGKNVVVLFFPLAFTSVCTAELCGVRDNYNVYEGLNAEVLGISVDSPFTLDKFKQEQNLNFRLLSDFNKSASTAYNSIYQDFVFGMKGVSKRAAFVIDKQGVVQHEEPNFENILSALKKLN
jgi:peroxiredoxin